MKVKDAMKNRLLVTVHPEDTLDVAAQVMLWAKVRELPVVEDDRVVGMLSAHDMVGRGGLHERVRHAMRESVIAVRPDDDLVLAGATLMAQQIDCLPVLDSGVLIGLLTTGDVLAHQVSRSVAPRSAVAQ
jgi:CBS domain-containing protein